MAKLAFIVAPNFRDPEFFNTKVALGEKLEVDIASTTTGQINGVEGNTLTPNLLIEDLSTKNYDGIVLVGGPGMYDLLYNDPDTTAKIVDKVKEFNSTGKLVAAICISPIVFAKANIIQGKNVTSWDSGGQQRTEIERAGGKFTGDLVTKDGNIITANGPMAATNFGKEISNYFKATD